MKTVSTRKFEFTHGRKPRGFGYWFFIDNLGATHEFRGLFTDAKKSAMKNLVGYDITLLT